MREWLNTIRDEWRPTRDRVLWAPVFLAVGIAIYFDLAREPALAIGLVAVAITGAALFWAVRSAPQWAYVVSAVFLMALGFAAAEIRTAVVASPLLTREIDFTRVEGRVQDITVADINPNTGRPGPKKVTLDSLIIEKLPPEQTPATIRLTTYHVPDDVVPGDRIALLAHLMPPSGAVVPGGFSFRQQSFFQQLGANGFTMGQFALIAKGKAPKDVWFNALRQKISARIAAQMPNPQSAVATALLAGERSSIPTPINDDLRDSGLYHLISISGLHIAIVCGVTFFVLRFFMALVPWIALHLPIKKIAAAGALLIGFCYSMLAGMQVATERSILMTGIALLAVMLDRSALSMRTIALAAFFVLLVQPENLLSASFQLSFAAVLSMIAFYESAGRKWIVASKEDSVLRKGFIYLAEIAVTTIVVSLATLPPILHHFGRFQIFGVLANAIAIPLTTFTVMPGGMAAMALMPLHLDRPFLKIVEWGIDGTLWVSHAVAHLPGAVSAMPNLPMGWYLLSSLGFLFLCFWNGRTRVMGGVVMVVAIVLGLSYGARPVVMIDDDATALGVSGGGEIAYIGKAPSTFERSNWRSVWGGDEVNNGKAIKDPMWQNGDVSVSCDDWACRIVTNKSSTGLSVVRSANVMNEECNWANMIVALDKAVTPDRQQNCSAKIIPYWSVYDGGGMAFYQTRDGGWTARPFTPSDERRPWTLKR